MSTLKRTQDGVALMEVTYERCKELLGLGAPIAYGPRAIRTDRFPWSFWEEKHLNASHYEAYTYYVRVDA